MANDIQFSIGANAKNFKVAIEQINKDVKTLQKSIMEKMSTVGFAFDGIVKTAKAISSVLSEPFKQFSRYEDAATRLAPLLGSLELAKELAGELRDEAANGTAPFEQLVQIAGRLAATLRFQENFCAVAKPENEEQNCGVPDGKKDIRTRNIQEAQ